MKIVGIFVDERKFSQLLLADFCALKRPGDVNFVRITSCCQPTDEEMTNNYIPLDAIVHKKLSLSLENTKLRNSNEFYRIHEGTVFIDPVEYVEPILNRYTQYKTLENCLNSGNIDECVFVPRFCLFGENEDENIRTFHDSGMKFPILCKPLSAHGKGPAHEMAILFNESALKDIKFPSVVQHFENHDGFLIKIYVIGRFYHIVARPSIRNLSQTDHPPIYFNSHNISKVGSCSELNEEMVDPEDSISTYIPLLQRLVNNLRCNLHLDLFGFDVIVTKDLVCESDFRESRKLAVIDLNIFPDYSCVPNYFYHLENLIREKTSLPKLDHILEMT